MAPFLLAIDYNQRFFLLQRNGAPYPLLVALHYQKIRYAKTNNSYNRGKW